jgi:hypothetical protein
MVAWLPTLNGFAEDATAEDTASLGSCMPRNAVNGSPIQQADIEIGHVQIVTNMPTSITQSGTSE